MQTKKTLKILEALPVRPKHQVTLGVQGLVIEDKCRVLLVRHGYRPGWHFPGGGVERGESLELSLERELLEETGVIATEPPVLFGVYAHFNVFPGDHIVLFVIERWRRETIPAPNSEIAEQKFFAYDCLPENISEGTRRRLDEVFRSAARALSW